MKGGCWPAKHKATSGPEGVSPHLCKDGKYEKNHYNSDKNGKDKGDKQTYADITGVKIL